MMDSRWLSRITPIQEAFQYKDWGALGGLDPYRQHQLVWKMFALPPKARNALAPFLFRTEIHDHLPRFYVLSKVVPDDRSGMWRVESQEYRPQLAAGDRLAFKLRANPVVKRPGAAVSEPDGRARLRVSGNREGREKHKVLRHDAVMDAKLRIGWKSLRQEERPPLAVLVQEAGARWLRGRADAIGCQIDETHLRADGHTIHSMQRGWDGKDGHQAIRLSTLDFEGTLEVTDPARLLSVLFNGIGPAKSFGCGLLLVRRL